MLGFGFGFENIERFLVELILRVLFLYFGKSLRESNWVKEGLGSVELVLMSDQ